MTGPLPPTLPAGPVLVCVAGSRRWADPPPIVSRLDAIEATGRLVCVIEGGARGADRIAGRWAAAARARGVGWVRFAAHWRRLGPSAGPARNQEMRDWAVASTRLPDPWHPFLLAFPLPGSVGTLDMIARWRSAQFPGLVVRPGGR